MLFVQFLLAALIGEDKHLLPGPDSLSIEGVGGGCCPVKVFLSLFI